ncbi:hypothetical protein L7F22_044378 [Adiantum nelumboides]|nr:hypothetical protein [Adiantum nelumboides]
MSVDLDAFIYCGLKRMLMPAAHGRLVMQELQLGVILRARETSNIWRLCIIEELIPIMHLNNSRKTHTAPSVVGDLWDRRLISDELRRWDCHVSTDDLLT